MNLDFRFAASRLRTGLVLLLGSATLMFSGCSVFHRGSKTANTPASVSSAAAVTPAAPATAKLRTVVRPAPDFTWVGAGGKPSALKALRGQPLVLIIAPSPEQGKFRKEVDRIDHLYLDLSARKTAFLAAFTAQPGRVLSNVPYALAQNGAAVAAAYGVPPGGFAVVVIGPDGNMDLMSQDVEAAQRLLDIINNSYQAQAASRTGLGS